MNIGFCLFKYFPFGGLQWNFYHIAQQCRQRGHRIRVYTHSWQGDIPQGFEIISVPKRAYTSHTSQQQFAAFVKQHRLNHPVDMLIGFNKIPGLDIYYAADNCLLHSIKQQPWRRLAPRYRHLLAFESAVFSCDRHTSIMLIAAQQKEQYQKHYAIQDERICILPPGIKRDCCAPAAEERSEIGRTLREEFTIRSDQYLLLAVGSGFKTKGLDRSLQAIQALPEALRSQVRLLVLGQDNPAPFKRLANRLGIASLVQFLGGRGDVPRFLFAADLLLHPAYNEAAGMALLEAGVAGLPVLASGACGFADYVAQYRFGRILPEPFSQSNYNRMLVESLQSEERFRWSENGIRFGREADIYDRPLHAAKFIEQVGAQR